ncbi:MAG TPA: hypothetical protein VFI48_04270 [Hyphomicrobiaceae bacterium]|nr:hypothetical protein [Hyphomicrobiaceae bacterium]
MFEVATFQSGTHVPDVRYYVDKDEAEYWAKLAAERGANARLAPIGLPRDTRALTEILAFCADRTAEARKHAVSLEQFIAELSAAMAIDGKVVITPGSVLHDRLADAADKVRERRQAPFASPRHRSTGCGVGQQ